MEETDSSCTCTSSITLVQRPICCCIQDSEHSSIQPEFPSLLFSECVPVRLNSVTKCCQAASLVDSSMTDDQGMPRLEAVLVYSPTKMSDEEHDRPDNGPRPAQDLPRFPNSRGSGRALPSMPWQSALDRRPSRPWIQAASAPPAAPLPPPFCGQRDCCCSRGRAQPSCFAATTNRHEHSQASKDESIGLASLTAAGDERERVEVGLACALRRGGAARVQVEVCLVDLRKRPTGTPAETIPDG